MNRLDYLIQYLIDEDPQYSEMQIPEDLQGRRDLFRALRNVREPRPVSEEFLRLQDEELQEQLEEKGIVDSSDMGEFSIFNSPFSISLWQGDITRLRVDAIVNAANAQMLGCFHPLHKCIDNAIHSAAGVQLREECHQLMLQQGHLEPTGTAKITKAYNLPCKHVIHTVGPIIPNGIPTAFQQEQLASCYRSIMQLADENHLESIAFCCISTGEFRFPNQLAAEIAVKTVSDFFDEHPESSVKQVIFNVFKDVDKRIYEGILRDGYMQTALDFLKAHNEITLATCEGNLPHLRIFQIMKQEGHVLYFATSAQKAVYRELCQNPNVEVLAFADNVSIRCSGMVSFDVADDVKRWIYDNNPVLPRLYTSYDKLEYFCMQIAEMNYFDLKPTPPVFKHYDLVTGETSNGFVGERFQ